MSRLFSSESVSEGHPDKVADRISDEIVDALLRKNKDARAAIETLVTTDYCLIAGEASGANVDFAAVARNAIKSIGYASPGFDAETVKIDVRVHEQSPEIAAAVAKGSELGAGDQGLVFGFACKETEALAPAALHYSHRLLERLGSLRHSGRSDLGPDAKAQLTLEYDGHTPRRAHTIVVSSQHSRSLSQEDLKALVLDEARHVLPGGWIDQATRVLVNPSGAFTIGGPAADTGLTGRKIIVDTYGGAAPHGGGAFSGKDATKVDRSAAYAARWLAKNIVAADLAERCVIQVAYAIGIAEPVSIAIDCAGTARVSEHKIERAARECVSLTPRSIRDRLRLDRPIYARTAAYGHFGREPDSDDGFSWERTDLAAELTRAVKGA
ncbi:MAG: methionine adenosyltransferase [Deltaproteobacteria bacterium]|nr:methionine adenosyltransferase [Deltaproteobacteria bacterium]